MTARKKAARRSPARKGVRLEPLKPLYREVRAVLEAARAGAYRAVNAAMVAAYWQVGRLIVEHEQGGRRRAAYGEAVLEELSERLTTDFGRGFDVRNLRYMRQFYLAFPGASVRSAVSLVTGNGNASRSVSGRVKNKRNALRSELPAGLVSGQDSIANMAGAGLRQELSWTHYRLLLGVEDAAARAWYMDEAAQQHWSTRQLERQISVLYYERRISDRWTATCACSTPTHGPRGTIRRSG